MTDKTNKGKAISWEEEEEEEEEERRKKTSSMEMNNEWVQQSVSCC